MKIDIARVNKALREIKERTLKIEEVLNNHSEKEILSNEILRLALKYLVIEIAEAMANILQHILAKYLGIAVKGYIDTINKAFEKGLITKDTFKRLKPFFDFRNALIHRYWVIDDRTFLDNLKTGYRNFTSFSDEIERYIEEKKQS
jgi:uncharacterized protein YutE (UPF0331/DUF86 family)